MEGTTDSTTTQPGQADGADEQTQTGAEAGTGTESTIESTTAETATLYDRTALIREQVKGFFANESDAEVHAAIREHVLGEIDALGPGAAISRDETTTIISAWRNGGRIYGHGTTAAAALADFQTHAGPAS